MIIKVSVLHQHSGANFPFGTCLFYQLMWKLVAKVAHQSLNHVQLFVIPWTIAHQAPLPMELSRQEYWNGSWSFQDNSQNNWLFVFFGSSSVLQLSVYKFCTCFLRFMPKDLGSFLSHCKQYYIFNLCIHMFTDSI